MSQKSGPFEASADQSPKANGSTHHNGAGSSTTSVEQLAQSLLRRQNKSTDERLAAIRHTIRTWDTRGAETRAGRRQVIATAPEPAETSKLVRHHGEPEWLSDPEPRTEQMWASDPEPKTEQVWPGEEPATEQVAAVARADDPDQIWYPRRRWLTSRLMIWLSAGAVLVFAIILLVTLLPANSHPAPVGTANTPSQPATGASTQYLAAAKQIDLAERTLTRGLHNTHDILRLPALAAVIGPYATALQTYETQLSKIHWPASAVSSGHALEASLRGYAEFLQTLPTVTSPNLGTWLGAFGAHSAYVQNLTSTLRQDLGLPS
jgi:hypothetical protein